jgi:hypothetical protein
MSEQTPIPHAVTGDTSEPQRRVEPLRFEPLGALNIYFIRHFEPDPAVDPRGNPSLSDVGVLHAQEVGHRYGLSIGDRQRDGVTVITLYAEGLRRTEQSARAHLLEAGATAQEYGWSASFFRPRPYALLRADDTLRYYLDQHYTMQEAYERWVASFGGINEQLPQGRTPDQLMMDVLPRMINTDFLIRRRMAMADQPGRRKNTIDVLAYTNHTMLAALAMTNFPDQEELWTPAGYGEGFQIGMGRPDGKTVCRYRNEEAEMDVEDILSTGEL